MKHFVLLCAMERGASCILTENRTCLLHGDLQKVSVFSLRSDQCKLVDYVNNFKLGVCKEWIFLFWVMNQSERSITKRKINVKLSPQTRGWPSM